MEVQAMRADSPDKRPANILLPPDTAGIDSPINTKTWGPRRSQDGQILKRSLLGDPQDFATMTRMMNKQNMDTTSGSQMMTPSSPLNSSAGEGHSQARFAEPQSPGMNATAGGNNTMAMSSIVPVDVADLDDETRLKMQLTTLAESKRKQRDDRLKSIKAMHIFERFEETRQPHIMARHAKRQAEWNAFRTRMARRLKKDPDDLVINRAEEYRLMLEEQDLITKATPIEARHGENIWAMSLRDAWTRYINVGGPFSGLEMPFIDRPELRPETIYSVRQPFSKTAVKRKERIGGESTKQRLFNEYSEAIQYLQPHEVEFDGLYVKGSGAERETEEKLGVTLKEKEAAEEVRRKEEETARRRAARMPNFGGGSTAPSTAAKSVAGGGAGTTVAGGDATVNATAVAAQGLDGGKWEPEVQGPAMTFETDRLLMEEVTGGLCERRMSCMNIGSTAIYYRWTKCEKRFEGVERIDSLPRFFLSDVTGAILPGEMKIFTFTFKSDKPGAFSEEWEFEGRPDVAEAQHKITLKGVCQVEDKTKVHVKSLEANLERQQMGTTVDEVIEELVDNVRTPRAQGRVLMEDPDLDRQVFIARNKEAQIYYSNTTLKLFRSLADSTFELLNFPEELRVWDSSLESLKRLMYAIEDDSERERHIVQFNEIMKVAGIPPTSTSMFNNICYELVAELADGIPDIASNIRKKLDLPDKVLEFKEGATRDLVYTTGPDLSIWRYDPHLLQIGGPPVEYAEQVEGEREGYVRIEKSLAVEVWGLAGATEEGEDGEAGEEGEGAVQGRGSREKRGPEDDARLEFEYLLRLNNSIYDNFANLTEKMALFNMEADLRSQVIAQVVQDLNRAAAEEIRTLIKEDKVDEARKIDPNQYQNIVDVDEIFRKVMKEEQEVEKAMKQSIGINMAEAEAH